MNKNYDFEPILTRKEFKANQERILKLENKKTKKRVLKRWVKNTLWVIFGAIIGIAIYQLFTIETTHTNPAGDYTCRGGILKICTGSEEVAKNLGV